jgi:hypothetical protein
MDTRCVSVVQQDQCSNLAVKLPVLPHSSDMVGGGHDGLDGPRKRSFLHDGVLL